MLLSINENHLSSKISRHDKCQFLLFLLVDKAEAAERAVWGLGGLAVGSGHWGTATTFSNGMSLLSLIHQDRVSSGPSP